MPPTDPTSINREEATDIAGLAEGVRRGDKTLLGRAITRIESIRSDHRDEARILLARLLPYTGKSLRIGISGVPGVGKSTFIDRFGSLLTADGHRVAVLAVDPSSRVSGGSILGDKTRMEKLSSDPAAFIRPSPSAGSLGGVTRRTRETILLAEAAGYDVILVETVGVGQSETQVADMVDVFMVLMLAGAGDELQGIKKGILEIADLIAVNKADGENRPSAERARAEYEQALHYLHSADSIGSPPVLTCSAMNGDGLSDIRDAIRRLQQNMNESGDFEKRRRRQNLRWMWADIESELLAALKRDPSVAKHLPRLEKDVLDGRLHPSDAARSVLDMFGVKTTSE